MLVHKNYAHDRPLTTLVWHLTRQPFTSSQQQIKAANACKAPTRSCTGELKVIQRLELYPSQSLQQATNNKHRADTKIQLLPHRTASAGSAATAERTAKRFQRVAMTTPHHPRRSSRS